MEPRFQRITPFLWFDGQAEDAVQFYTSIFDDSRILQTVRRPDGAVLTVAFELDGLPFTALNGGPHYKLNEAFSLVVSCRSQAEVDHYWGRLAEGGDESAQRCGWLKDRFGLSWQVVPTELPALIGHPDPEKARRATQAMLQMRKLDLDALRRAVA